MRTLLICHAEHDLDRVALARWLASISTVSGIIILQETRGRTWRRIRNEFKRSGPWGFLDVLAWRTYYRVRIAETDRRWERKQLEELCRRYPEAPATTPVLLTASPNSAEAREFIQRAAPDLMIARCKTLLKEEIFTLPGKGTVVMHPGICPEYRNAHGCFWALANGDLKRVGMTLLRIDRGVDTGPIFGYYMCRYDECKESHIVIQHRTVLDNLDAIGAKLQEICKDRAVPMNTTGRSSAIWGQPRLTKYLQWKRQAAKRKTPAG